MVFSEASLTSIARQLTDEIDLSPLDASSWQRMASAIADYFPGSYAAFQNVDVVDQRLNFVVSHGLEQNFLSSYLEHYAAINPWIRWWRTTPPGTPMAASRNCPASTFANTEFYNEWLLPQKTAQGAAGIKIPIKSRSQLVVVMHYPHWMEEQYDEAITTVLGMIRGSLRRALTHAMLLQAEGERQIASASLVSCTGRIAFVIDGKLNLRNANAEAEAAFREGRTIACRGGRIVLWDQAAARWLGQSAASLAIGAPTDAVYFLFGDADSKYKVTAFALPLGFLAGEVTGSWERLILVLLEDLGRSRQHVDFANLATAYRLTSAEVQLSELLLSGRSLKDASAELGFTRESGRDRLKRIFAKTGTHRQGELIALLSRFCS